MDEIAAVPGVDIIFFGPGDFSILSGIPGQMNHELIKDAMRKVSAAVQKHGKNWGMPIFNIEHAQEVLSLGGRFLCHSARHSAAEKWLRRHSKTLRPAGRDQ